MSKRKTIRECEQEIQALRDQLTEAQEALHAIQTGQVDALVVYAEEGEQVYTLQGADRPYQMLVESMSEGAATLNQDGTILYCNRRLAEMLGMPLEAVLGSSLARLVARGHQKTFKALIEQGKRATSKGEIAFRRLDGTRLPALVSMQSLQIDQDRGVCLVATDLTQQKRNEEILAAEQLARSILDHAAEAIVVCDIYGNVIRASQAVYEIVPENPLQQPLENILPLWLESNGGRDKFSVATVLAGQSLEGVEARSDLDSRTSRHWILGAVPLDNNRGEIIGCVVTLTDITERKRAEAEREQLLAQVESQKEAALQERDRAETRAAELDATINGIADAVFIYGPENEIVQMNPVAQRLLGYSSEHHRVSLAERAEVIQVEWADGQPVTDLDMLPARRALRGETVSNVQMAWHHVKTRERSFVSVSAGPIRTPDGQMRGAVLTATDITRLQETQLRLQIQNQELETLLQVSHHLSSTLKMDALMGLILDHLRTVAPYSDATIYAVEGQELTRLAFRGHDLLDEPGSPVRISLTDAPIHARVVSDGRAIVIPDAWADTPDAQALRRTPAPLLQIRLLELHSWIGVPLSVRDRVIGVLVLHHSQTALYNAHHGEVISAFASQAALALENAQLYERAKELATNEERQRLARDLHDAVSQSLFAASTITDVLPRIMERNPQEGQRRLQELNRLTRGAQAEMRTLLLELHPSGLVQAPLGDLLQQLATALSGRTRTPVQVHVAGDRCLLPEVQVALYRIAQEALNNIVKHAQATQVDIDVRCNAEHAELLISDNGRGFDIKSFSADHMGLRNMRERAAAIGAVLSVESQAGHGTEISVVWDAQRE